MKYPSTQIPKDPKKLQGPWESERVAFSLVPNDEAGALALENAELRRRVKELAKQLGEVNADWIEPHVKDRVRLIQEHVGKRLGFSRAEILGPRKFYDLVWARQLAMALTFEFLELPRKQVAALFGNRVRQAVFWAQRAVKDRTEVYAKDWELYEQLRRELKPLLWETDYQI